MREITLEELDPAPWGGQQWLAKMLMPNGYGGEDWLTLKLVSTKGMPGVGQYVRDGAAVHVYSREERVWYGGLGSWEPDKFVPELAAWLDSKALGAELLATAPVEQLVVQVAQWHASLSLESPQDPERLWDEVLSLVAEIGARMGRVSDD